MINCLTDCPDIGRCCRVFCLTHSDGIEYIRKAVAETTPFKIVKEHYMVDQIYVYATCNNLQSDGLCRDCNNRPETCVQFQPKSNMLCVLYEGPDKGLGEIESIPELMALRSKTPPNEKTPEWRQ